MWQFNWLRLISTGLWTVLNDFWNEATGNQNNPNLGNHNWKIDQSIGLNLQTLVRAMERSLGELRNNKHLYSSGLLCQHGVVCSIGFMRGNVKVIIGLDKSRMTKYLYLVLLCSASDIGIQGRCKVSKRGQQRVICVGWDWRFLSCGVTRWMVHDGTPPLKSDS